MFDLSTGLIKWVARSFESKSIQTIANAALSGLGESSAKYKTDGQTLVGSMQQVAKLSVLTCCVSVQTVSKEHGPSFTAVL